MKNSIIKQDYRLVLPLLVIFVWYLYGIPMASFSIACIILILSLTNDPKLVIPFVIIVTYLFMISVNRGVIEGMEDADDENVDKPPRNKPPRPPGNKPPKPPGNKPPRPPGNKPPGNKPPGNKPPRQPGNKQPNDQPLTPDDKDKFPGQLDETETLISAYENMNNMLGSGVMANMSADSAKLAQQQQGLIETMKNLGPIVENYTKMMKMFDSSKISKMMETFNPKMNMMDGFDSSKLDQVVATDDAKIIASTKKVP